MIEDKYIKQSILAHSVLIVFFSLVVLLFRPREENKNLVEFRVIEATKKVLKKTNVMPLKAAPVNIPQPKKKSVEEKKLIAPKRKVFGVTKKSLTTNSNEAIKAKSGNTISKNTLPHKTANIFQL